MDYNFYFDESFHDRKIVISPNGEMNTLRDDDIDSYIGVFWGCPHKQLFPAIESLKEFEEKQRRVLGLSDDIELKSTIIKRKNYTFGIASFNKFTLEFYNSLFSILLDCCPIIQINIISKVEFFLRSAFNNTVFPFWFSRIEKSFFYSLTKFILVYHNTELLTALYEVDSNAKADKLRNVLVKQLSKIIEATYGIERKVREVEAFMQMRVVLENVDFNVRTEKKLAFQYNFNFMGLIQLLQECNIDTKNVNVVIDNDENTFASSKAFGFKKVKQADSKNNLQLHLSDFLSGFIGRMLFAMNNDPKAMEDPVHDIDCISENNLRRKRLLDEKWFVMGKQHFELYKLIYKVLIEQQHHYWSCMTMSYCDSAAMFYELLRYMSSFNQYEDFLKVDPSMHAEYYNSCACIELHRAYVEMGMEGSYVDDFY